MFPFDDVIMDIQAPGPVLENLQLHDGICYWFNSMAPGRCGSIFKSVISEHLLSIQFTSISYEITLRWMPQNTLDYVNIGSGNGLVSSDNKPLPEAMLNQICVAIRRHKATMTHITEVPHDGQFIWFHGKLNIYIN